MKQKTVRYILIVTLVVIIIYIGFVFYNEGFVVNDPIPAAIASVIATAKTLEATRGQEGNAPLYTFTISDMKNLNTKYNGLSNKRKSLLSTQFAINEAIERMNNVISKSNIQVPLLAAVLVTPDIPVSILKAKVPILTGYLDTIIRAVVSVKPWPSDIMGPAPPTDIQIQDSKTQVLNEINNTVTSYSNEKTALGRANIIGGFETTVNTMGIANANDLITKLSLKIPVFPEVSFIADYDAITPAPVTPVVKPVVNRNIPAVVTPVVKPVVNRNIPRAVIPAVKPVTNNQSAELRRNMALNSSTPAGGSVSMTDSDRITRLENEMSSVWTRYPVPPIRIVGSPAVATSTQSAELRHIMPLKRSILGSNSVSIPNTATATVINKTANVKVPLKAPPALAPATNQLVPTPTKFTPTLQQCSSLYNCSAFTSSTDDASQFESCSMCNEAIEDCECY